MAYPVKLTKHFAIGTGDSLGKAQREHSTREEQGALH